MSIIITDYFPPATDFSAPSPHVYQNFLQVGAVTSQWNLTAFLASEHVLQVLLLVLQGKYLIAPLFVMHWISKNWDAGLLFCERTPPPSFRHQHLTYMPAAPPLPAHFLQPREASKTLREIGVITVDVPASRSNSQTQIFMNLFISSKCVTVFIGYRTLGKSVLIAPFCKYKQFLLYYYGIIFQSLCEALYLIRDWCLPSNSPAGSALKIILNIFE